MAALVPLDLAQTACIALRSSGDILAHRVSDLRLSSSTGTWVRRATGPWPDGDHPVGVYARAALPRRRRISDGLGVEHPSDPGGVQVVPQAGPRLEPSIRPGTSAVAGVRRESPRPPATGATRDGHRGRTGSPHATPADR